MPDGSESGDIHAPLNACKTICRKAHSIGNAFLPQSRELLKPEIVFKGNVIYAIFSQFNLEMVPGFKMDKMRRLIGEGSPCYAPLPREGLNTLFSDQQRLNGDCLWQRLLAKTYSA